MKPIEKKKGNSLEFLTASYFQAHGYLVRRSVKLSVAAGTAEATDIDLLAIRFNTPLAEERVVVDCKDRKKSHPFERILWTLGLSSFSRAQRAVVVTPKVPWQAREFAAQGAVEILDALDLETFLDSAGGKIQAFGEADPEVANQFEVCKKHMGEENKHLLREDLKLRQMLTIGSPLTNFNRVVATFSMIKKQPAGIRDDVAWISRYICFNAAVVAAVMLVRFSAESKWTPEKDWSAYARKKLTYGDTSPVKAQQLAKLAFGTDFFEGLPPPHYTDEIIEVIKALISRPDIAVQVPYALDYHLLGCVLGKTPKDAVHPVLGARQEEVLKMGKRILSALAYAAEMDVSIWEDENTSTVPKDRAR
ncbi:MAG TPA: restriction endonuclease [Syntrophobacteraceae bacterium]|nr:restriction endonuclease [Syntrophobacteraceae bacterium]